MDKENKKIEQTRNLLVQMALDDICSVDDFSDFYRHAYYVIAKLGLQRKAKEEDLFNKGDWSNPQCRDSLIKELRKFLIRHINMIILFLLIS